jgi:hypothetical protein
MKFIKERDISNEFDSTTIIVESSSVSLPEILDDFASFLKACGYSLPNIDNPLIINDSEEQ